jgi:hypothetical protein
LIAFLTLYVIAVLRILFREKQKAF